MANLQEKSNLTIAEISKLKEETTQKINDLLNEFEEKTGVTISRLEFTHSETTNTYIGTYDGIEEHLLHSDHTPASVTLKISI